MMKKISKLVCIFSGLMVLGTVLFGATTASATPLSTLGVSKSLTSGKLEEPYTGIFPPNNITGWNPNECTNKGGANSDSCFKIDSSVDTQSFWYPEGCLAKCKRGSYAHTAYDSENPFLRDDTESDEEYGGMQYIYAENYDIDYNIGYGKFTPNGGNSTQKYYWIVLPDQAYSNGLGETYVASFENVDEPIYLITFDVHACEHQSEDYCGKANADPDGVAAGREFLGAFTNDAGNPTPVANILGKLTSLCRINGRGEVTASQNANNMTTSTNGATANSSSGSSSSDVTWSDGWITDGMTGYVKDPAIGSSYQLGDSAHNGQYSTGGPNKITLHSTDGGPGDGNSGLALYGNDGSGIYPAHFTINLKDKKVFQHLPITKPSDAVKSHDDSAGVQIEIIGFSDSHTDSSYYLLNEDNFGDEEWAYLGELLNAISSETGIPLTTSVDWANPSRLSSGDFKSYQGILGHMHVPDNDHTDPGNIWPMVQKAIDGNCTTYDGEYPEYFQWGQSWSGVPYNGGTIGDSGCGPSSMAMIATAVAGTDIFPNDVVDVTSPHGIYVYTSGPGMSALDQKVGEKYGFEVVNVDYSNLDDAERKMRQYLEDGYMLHFSGAGSAPFTSGGHYVGAFAIDGDTVKVADSNLGNRDYNLHDLVHAGLHGGAFSASRKGNSSRNTCDNDYCSEGNEGSHSGGFTSVEEVDSQIMDPYRDLAANHPEEWSKYHITAGTPYNCFSFSNYFITKYTSMSSFYGVPGVDGGGYAEEFYNLYHNEYPELTLSNTPTPFSVAGCGDKYYAGGNSASHTFIVLGVNEQAGTMIYGQAAYGSGPAGIVAGEVSLDANDPYHVGPGCQYTDFSKYVTGL